MVYSGTVLAKTNDEIPLFDDGRPMHSKYNPAGEAKNFALDIETGFVVVAGIGGGFHLKEMLERMSGDYFILAVEKDRESLDFCKKISTVKKICESPNLKLCTVDTLVDFILENYFPSAYPKFSFVAHRAWENHFTESCTEIKKIIEDTLKKISADFSVQSHFGKIWQHNILINSRNHNKNSKEPIDKNKTAAVIAAGPSLDSTVSMLKKFPDDYIIFSTDTAYGTLILNGIVPDYVLSIDGQFVSAGHFIEKLDSENRKTKFVFDLCSNPSAIQYLMQKGYSVSFIKSRHPLCSVVPGCSELSLTENGSGTVTITACDYARQLGIKKIRVFGADFSYNNGKPYCKGTYLENNFSANSSRILNQETQHSALMFRTELVDCENKNLFGDRLVNPKTSSVLKSFRETLMDWASNFNYKLEEDTLVNNSNAASNATEKVFLDFNEWIKNIESLLFQENSSPEIHSLINNQSIRPLLPYVAWLRKNKENNKLSFFALLKLAYYQLSRYTKFYEK